MRHVVGEATLPEATAGDGLRALASSLLFGELDAEMLNWLAPRCTRVHVRGGETLVRQGDAGDALFVVAYGRLRVVLIDDAGTERILGEIGRGETVGEMALLTGEARSSSVIAVRDSEVIRVGRDEFQRLTTDHPRMMLELIRVLIARYQSALREQHAARLSTLAVLPHAAVPVRGFTRDLVRVLRTRVPRVLHVDAERARAAVDQRRGNAERVASLAAWLHDVELEHDLVVYEADPDDTAWTTACLRQADTILHVGSGGADPPPAPPAALSHARSGSVRPRAELVLLHAPGAPPSDTAAWLRNLPDVDQHHHVTVGDDRDYDRIARCLLGTGIGLVLGGGGARGLAHIGVLRALDEARVPVDHIGGTSAGANIAAMHALGWNWERVLAETRRTFVDGGSLQDYTLPVHSLLRGERYRRIGEDLYGDRLIEDLPIPFFCVSTNLTRGETFVHRTGMIRRGLRASMTVPGVAPAVFEGREVLVDGGVMNNLPIDVMRDLGPGTVIGVNVSPRQEMRLDADYPDTPSPWRSLAGRLLGAPSPVPTIASILTRVVTIPRAAVETDPRNQPDLLLEPPVAGFKLLQWNAIDALVEIGYRYALERLEQWERAGDAARRRTGDYRDTA